MTSVAKVREMPYLTSAQVTGLPSCHLASSRIVNFHVLPPSDMVPVSVARSGVSLDCSSLVAPGGKVVSVRSKTRLANWMSAPT